MEEKTTSITTTMFPIDFDTNRYKSWISFRLGTEKVEDVIVLPTPSDLSFNTSIKFNDLSLGVIEGIYDTFKDEMESTGGNIADSLKNTAMNTWNGTVNSSSAKEGGISTQVAMATSLLNTLKLGNGILDPIKDLARRELRNQGIALNPNTELYFQDVGLRSFNFSFRLAPKSYLDSETAMYIVQTFERHAHPKSKSKFLWDYPSEAIITFYEGTEPNDKLPAINKCVITNFSHKYNGGTNVFFENGFPTIIDISITFKEIAVNTSETINRKNNDTERKQFSKRNATVKTLDDIDISQISNIFNKTVDNVKNKITNVLGDGKANVDGVFLGGNINEGFIANKNDWIFF